MAFNILGLNHKTAPVSLREKVAFTEDRLAAALRTLRQEGGVAEVVILSTCNRTELYWSGEASASDLSSWLERHHGSNLDLAASLYVHQDRHAVEHAFNVASGLDSMVLGEAQILGQLKDAYRVAQEAGSTGPALNKLFQAAFSAAKRVRSETQIGANAVSIASAAVSLTRRMYADLSEKTALMIGAGEMIGLAARHFATAGVKRIVIANRTLSRAQILAAEIKGYAVDLSALDKELAEADIVVSCTASTVPIITKRAAAAAVRARRHRPIFMLDLAVPRDIESGGCQARGRLLVFDRRPATAGRGEPAAAGRRGGRRALAPGRGGGALSRRGARPRRRPGDPRAASAGRGHSPANARAGPPHAGVRQIHGGSHRISRQYAHQPAAALARRRRCARPRSRPIRRSHRRSRDC